MPFFNILLLLLTITINLANGESCDYSQGRWVLDPSYPLYNDSTCPFIDKEFSCRKNGRPDHMYLEYRWQPLRCNLTRFDGGELLQRLRGKSVMFVGDSLSRNQWTSFLCLLHAALPTAKYNITRLDDLSIFTFPDFEVKLMLNRNVYLVDIVREDIGRVLKLDSIEGGKLWKDIDVLIFNTWHWWNRRGAGQPWDYIQIGNKIYKDMNRVAAFERALNTWAGWVEANIDPTKTMVFFQGISPSHYNGTDWNQPKARTCLGQEQPVSGTTYPSGLPAALTVLKQVLAKISTPVKLLDVTELSLLRKDGHPSVYGLNGRTGMDCSHWCIPGVPDTWTQILYNLII